MPEILFKETTQKPQVFFNLLPSDWQDGIVPFWSQYEHTARVFVLYSGNEVVGGGVIFASVSPDTIAYKEEAQKWFDSGYLYIGFLFIAEDQRGKGFGVKWLNEIFKIFPRQKFWLTIEEYSLCSFYIKNGFRLVRKVHFSEGTEWLMTNDNAEVK